MSKKGNVLVIAAGLGQVPLINFMKSKGYQIIVVDPFINSPGVKLAHKHIVCDIREYRLIGSLIKNLQFDFIVSDQSNIAVNTVSYLNAMYNKKGNSFEVTNKFVDKIKMRQFACSIGIPVPKYKKVISVSDIFEFVEKEGLPIVIKPVDSQGSRGVFKIDESNIENINYYFAESLKYASCGCLIAEEYICGREVTVEGFASDGKHKTLAVSLKNHFRMAVASEILYPAQIPNYIYNEIERLNDLFVENSGLKFGITHAEYMIDIDTGMIKLIEIACRGGGNLISSEIIRWVSGIDVYEMLYDNLIGGSTDVKSLKVLKRNAIVKFLEFESGRVKEINGVEEICRMENVLYFNLNFKPEDVLKPAENDVERHGFFIAKADDLDTLEDVVEKIIKTIKVRYY